MMSPVPEPTVFIVEDEPPVRTLLLRILERSHIRAEGFASAEEFLASLAPEYRGCLLLDLTLPGMNGLQLQQALRERHAGLPVIFLTGSADVKMATAGMRAGAFDLIEKPFDDVRLLTRVREALELDAQRRAQRVLWGEINGRLEALTAREREVLDHIVAGHTNKMIAQLLDASPRTVEVHRARIMRKIKAESLPELVRLMLLWREGLSDG